MLEEMQASVERSIGRLEGKMDYAINELSELKIAFNSLEAGRLSRLERDFANLVGKMTVIVSIASLLVSLLINGAVKYLFN